MKQLEMKKLLKIWIIDVLDRVKSKRDLDYNLGVVSGFERVYFLLFKMSVDKDKDIEAAYKQLDARLYPKK